MSITARIRRTEYYLPERVLSNDDLALEFPQWNVKKIAASTGIVERRIAAPEECASDLAEQAANKLLSQGEITPGEIDFVLLCTQSPDYFLPSTACLLQDRLGIPKTAGALDFNLGQSGFVYGLGLAKGLVETGQARNLLLLTADTYSKFIHPADKSVRTVFGDGATASWISADGEAGGRVGPFTYGTDGSGANHLLVPAGGLRTPHTEQTAIATADANGNMRSQNNLYMNGVEIFNFTMDVVPDVIEKLLVKAELKLDEIDLFVFHQANAAMLEHLRKTIKIPESKFAVHLRDCGNTVSSTIPIALREMEIGGRLQPGMKVMVVGFGVGLSWAAGLIQY